MAENERAAVTSKSREKNAAFLVEKFKIEKGGRKCLKWDNKYLRFCTFMLHLRRHFQLFLLIKHLLRAV